MRSLCTCAALAVATAFAQGHLADAHLRSSEIQKRGGNIVAGNLESELVNCLEEIKEFRTNLSSGAKAYETISDVSTGELTATDLTTFLQSQTCEGLQKGEYDHIVTTSGGKIFVITAKKSTSRANETCASALAQWRTGFSAFNGKYPPKYKNPTEKEGGDNPYANPDAAALVSLLHKDPQHVICGTLSECAGELDLLCYFKPSGIDTEADPVDPALWHALEAQEKLKPKLEQDEKEAEEEDVLEAVNNARKLISLEPFTSPNLEKSLKRVKRSARSENVQDAVQEFLYTLTCDNITSSKISPSPTETDDFTVIYYIKDGDTPPTMEDAVKYWESGFDKLKYKRPPAFTKAAAQADTESGPTDSAGQASDLYNDSAVAGYVSIMADEPRNMACVVATGCQVPEAENAKSRGSGPTSKSGLVCVVHKATLVSDQEPISKATWAKIMEQKGYPLPKFTKLADDKNCLEEMNAVRTQEKLGLKAFAAKQETKTETNSSELVVSTLMQSVTCPAIGGATAKTGTSTGPVFSVTDGKTSLMYHSVADITCSAAVEAWKKGSEKFTSAPPAYSSEEAVYKDAAATNFVSLITDKETTTTATCYSTGCATAGIVCELSAAALVEKEIPVSEATWTKYSEIGETSGVAGFSKAALLGTVVMALAAGVFFL